MRNRIRTIMSDIVMVLIMAVISFMIIGIVVARVVPESGEIGSNTVKLIDGLVLDHSEADEGIVEIRYIGEYESLYLTVNAVGKNTVGSNNYTYIVQRGRYLKVPLCYGAGSYSFNFYLDNNGNKGNFLVGKTVESGLSDKDSIYTRKNSYVNIPTYNNEYQKVISELMASSNKITYISEALTYVKENYKYLDEKIDTAYIPDISKFIKLGEGNRLEFASLFAGLMRSNGIPCKVVICLDNKEKYIWNEVYYNDTWNIVNPVQGEMFIGNSNDATIRARYYKSQQVFNY